MSSVWAANVGTEDMSRTERTIALLAAGLVLVVGILAVSTFPNLLSNPHERHDCAEVSQLTPQDFQKAVAYLVNLGIQAERTPEIEPVRLREGAGIQITEEAIPCLRAAVESQLDEVAF
jgi:hypothetical protein